MWSCRKKEQGVKADILKIPQKDPRVRKRKPSTSMSYSFWWRAPDADGTPWQPPSPHRRENTAIKTQKSSEIPEKGCKLRSFKCIITLIDFGFGLFYCFFLLLYRSTLPFSVIVKSGVLFLDCTSKISVILTTNSLLYIYIYMYMFLLCP